MFRKTKILAMLLILAMFLCACGGGSEGDKKNGQSPENESASPEETKKWLDDAPERDFGGYAFRMYIEDGRNDMYIEEEIGEPVDDAVWMRNKIVEDRYNIEIRPVWFEQGLSTPGENPILAGEDLFDILINHGRWAYMYVNKNLVADWIANMTYADLSKPWWNQDIVEESSYFNRLYAVTGDIAYSTLAATMCIYFNKDLFANLGIPYPYDDVKSGAWTLDKFMGIAKQGSAEISGDGLMTFGEDRYGLAMLNQFGFPISALYIGGDKVVKKNEDGYPVLSIYTPRTISIYEKIFDMLDSDIAFCPINGVPSPTEAFMGGLALFYDNGMGGAVGLRKMEAEIGIVPFPKYDAQTPRYYSLMESNAQMITLPITANDFERTSIILEAMASEGHRTIIPAYYELTLKTKHARDNESFEMLDIIKSSSVVDWGYLNGDLTGELSLAAHFMFIANNRNFTSFYEKHEKAAMANIQKFIDENEY